MSVIFVQINENQELNTSALTTKFGILGLNSLLKNELIQGVTECINLAVRVET